jgi:hypothetical protein
MNDLDNPFKYGVVVTGDDFVGRKSELSELAREVHSGKSIVLYSHRRMGKSSLVAEFSRLHSREYVFVKNDLYGKANLDQFLSAYAAETTRAAFGSVDKIASGIRDILKGSMIRMVFTPEGEIGFEFPHSRPTQEDITRVIDLPERIAAKRGRRLIVVFDEFQEVASFGGVGLIKTMRARIQHHGSVTYIFSGSKRHLLRQIFEEKEGAFFMFAKSMQLGPIPPSEFKTFIISRFKSFGGSIQGEVVDGLLDVTGGHPYYTQQIAREMYFLSPRGATSATLAEALEIALAQKQPLFSVAWDSLKSPMHRSYLAGLAKEPGAERYGRQFIERYGLVSRTNVERAEKQLELKGLVEGGRVIDPLFTMWLRRVSSP